MLHAAHGEPLLVDLTYVAVRQLVFRVAQHPRDVVAAGVEAVDVANLPRHHAQLLEVDEAVDAVVVAQVDEGQVLGDDGEEGDDGSGHAAHH